MIFPSRRIKYAMTMTRRRPYLDIQYYTVVNFHMVLFLINFARSAHPIHFPIPQPWHLIHRRHTYSPIRHPLFHPPKPH